MNDGDENRQLRHASLAALCGNAACVDKRVYASSDLTNDEWALVAPLIPRRSVAAPSAPSMCAK
jgi:hypothetical protein